MRLNRDSARSRVGTAGDCSRLDCSDNVKPLNAACEDTNAWTISGCISQKHQIRMRWIYTLCSFYTGGGVEIVERVEGSWREDRFCERLGLN